MQNLQTATTYALMPLTIASPAPAVAWRFIGDATHNNLTLSPVATLTVSNSSFTINNTIFSGVTNVYLNDFCAANTVHAACSDINFSQGCTRNIIQNGTSYITFGSGCGGNIIGPNCYAVTFGPNCYNCEVYTTEGASTTSPFIVPANLVGGIFRNGKLVEVAGNRIVYSANGTRFRETFSNSGAPIYTSY